MAVRRAKLVALMLACASVGAGAWWWLRPQPGFVTGMYPIDDERAVFTMRHNRSNGPAQAYVGVVDVSRGVVWSRELPATTYSDYARHGLTVSAQQVTVKVSDFEHDAQIIAFDLATGTDRWRSDRLEFSPSEFPSQPYVVLGERPMDDGTQLLHGDHDRAVARFVARRSADGTSQWSHDLRGSGVRQVLVTAEVLAYRAENRWVFLDRDDGSVVREIQAFGAACVDAGRFVVWGNDGRLVTVDPTIKGAPVEEQPLASIGIARTCGVHGEHLVFTVARSWDRFEDRGFELVGVTRDSAAVAWRIDMGPWEPMSIARQRDNDDPSADPLSGELADYVPFLAGNDDTDGVMLVVADLVRREIAWQSPPHAELLHYQVFRGTGRQHFLDSAGRVAAIDGETGKLTAAVDLAHERSRGFHAAGGRLWLYSMHYAQMSSLPWVVLDGRTLATVGPRDPQLSPVDVTEDVRRWLEAP